VHAWGAGFRSLLIRGKGLMRIRKYCLCGCVLDREVTDEEVARQVILLWRHEHIGEGHGPASEREYQRAVSRIIGTKVAGGAKEFKPMLHPKMRFRVIKGGG
jgi:hypothetical protein